MQIIPGKIYGCRIIKDRMVTFKEGRLRDENMVSERICLRAISEKYLPKKEDFFIALMDLERSHFYGEPDTMWWNTGAITGSS